MNEVRISGKVDATPRMSNGRTDNVLRFDLKHELQVGSYWQTVVLPVRILGDRALHFERQLCAGDSVTITGVVNGEKFTDRNNRELFHVFIEAREVEVKR